MRFFEISRFFSHSVLAAALTGFAFLSMPITGVLASAPQQEVLEFHDFGSGGEHAEDVEFVWQTDVTQADVDRILTGEPEPAEEGEPTDPKTGESTEGAKTHSTSTSTTHTATHGDIPRMLGGRERVAERNWVSERSGVPVSAIAKRSSKGKCGDPLEEIRMTEANSYEVERWFIEHYAGSMKRINTLGAVGRHDGPDGKPDGFVVGRIKCGSPLHQGGLRNGDVVHRINGHKVNNVIQALGTYNKVRKDEVVEVELTRRDGKSLTLTYEML